MVYMRDIKKIIEAKKLKDRQDKYERGETVVRIVDMNSPEYKAEVAAEEAAKAAKEAKKVRAKHKQTVDPYHKFKTLKKGKQVKEYFNNTYKEGE